MCQIKLQLWSGPRNPYLRPWTFWAVNKGGIEQQVTATCARVNILDGHIKDIHRILYGDHSMGPTNFLIWDPCPVGFPETLAVAHVVIASVF